MGLKQFERRLERLVEGAFAKAFRSGLQPVEIGRRIVREMDDRRQVGVRGVIAPNDFTVWVSGDDHKRLEGLETALLRDLADYAREHAREEGYRFVGPVEVSVETDPGMSEGDLWVDAEINEAGGGSIGSLVLPGGDRIRLTESPLTIGRLDDCTVVLDDPKVSRRHAELRPDVDSFRVVDLDSTNGTQVNGRSVTNHVLTDGDEITIGDVVLRFEAS